MDTINLKPYFPETFDFNNIKYSRVYNDKNNKKTIFLYDKEIGNKIYIQSPECKNVMNIITKDKYSELNIPIYGKNQYKINNFVNFLKQLDSKIINDAKINKKEWFDQAQKIKYRSLIKNIHDDYIDTVEYKMGMFNNGIIKLKVTSSTSITEDQKQITINNLHFDSYIRTIFQVYAIWITDDLFGLFLKPIKIDQKTKLIQEINFIDDSDNETIDSEIDNMSDYSETQKNIVQNKINQSEKYNIINTTEINNTDNTINIKTDHNNDIKTEKLDDNLDNTDNNIFKDYLNKIINEPNQNNDIVQTLFNYSNNSDSNTDSINILVNSSSR